MFCTANKLFAHLSLHWLPAIYLDGFGERKNSQSTDNVEEWANNALLLLTSNAQNTPMQLPVPPQDFPVDS